MPSRSGAPRSGAHLAFTSTEAAAYLGVSVATVRRWSNAGLLSGSRTPGGQRRFSRADLDAFVRSLQRTDVDESVRWSYGAGADDPVTPTPIPDSLPGGPAAR